MEMWLLRSERIFYSFLMWSSWSLSKNEEIHFLGVDLGKSRGAHADGLHRFIF
jgi:hypothetical protein